MLQQSALLLVEFQKEWLNPEGKLAHLFQDKMQMEESVKNAVRITEAARMAGISIVHSGLSFSENYTELGKATEGLRAAIPKHKTFLCNTHGSEFAEPFVPQKNEFVVAGRTGASVFAGSNLDSYLRNNTITTLYIMGYAMHVCVESTIRAAHDLGYQVVLIADASAAFTAVQKQYVLEEIMHHFGKSISTQEFLKLINNEVF